MSYIEIYKEELRDLLDLDTSNKDLHVREDDQGNTGTAGELVHGLMGRGHSSVVEHLLVEGRKEMFYLTMHSTHFVYGYIASDIW